MTMKEHIERTNKTILDLKEMMENPPKVFIDGVEIDDNFLFSKESIKEKIEILEKSLIELKRR